jgi:hypothetical protein
MPQKRLPFNLSSIIAGSNEGMPTSGANRFKSRIHLFSATISNPVLIWVAAQEALWYSVAALLSVFLLQAVLLQLYMKRRMTWQSNRILPFAVVLTTNILTYVIGRPIFEYLDQAVVSFAEIQVLLSALFFLLWRDSLYRA